MVDNNKQQVKNMENPKLEGVKRVEFRLDAKTLEFINRKQNELKLTNKSETLEVLLQPYIYPLKPERR